MRALRAPIGGRNRDQFEPSPRFHSASLWSIPSHLFSTCKLLKKQATSPWDVRVLDRAGAQGLRQDCDQGPPACQHWLAERALNYARGCRPQGDTSGLHRRLGVDTRPLLGGRKAFPALSEINRLPAPAVALNGQTSSTGRLVHPFQHVRRPSFSPAALRASRHVGTARRGNKTTHARHSLMTPPCVGLT